jgi:hypothetical protein
MTTPDTRFRHQFNVGMDTPTNIDDHGLDRELYIYPAAHALANRLVDHNLTACGRLDHPPLVKSVVVTESNISVRGLLQYAGLSDPYGREYLLRFDVLAG